MEESPLRLASSVTPKRRTRGAGLAFPGLPFLPRPWQGDRRRKDRAGIQRARLPPEAYAVFPALPAGLTLDVASGVIGGTPSVVSPAADYTVTATNSGGSTTAALRITVNDAPPSGLLYATSSASYLSGLAIAPNAPTASGGAVVSWSVAPALPPGLALDAATGVIGGTPTVAVGLAAYLVTAANSGGSTTATVTIQVTSSTSGAASAIAAGNSHACAVVHGAAQCWGANTFGQLGDGTTTDADRPVQVAGLTRGVQAVAAGGDHACALVNGGVWCWGYNGYGQLGDGTTTSRSVPAQVSGLGSGVQAIAAGPRHSCALVAGGVRCWGDNGYGQLGDGTTTGRATPVQVSGLAGGVQAIDVGTQHSCAVVDGGARCWGRNYIGQLGDGSRIDRWVPVVVLDGAGGRLAGVQAISARGDQACAIVNGGVRCWGANAYGALGDGSTVSSAVPVQVSGLTTGAQAIGTGGSHACAVVSGGVWCWGNGANGRLGSGATGDSAVPVQVSGLAIGALAVTAGGAHTCALVSGGVRCWGGGYQGQLGTGDGSTADRTTPVQVFGLTQGLQALAAGRAHTCALVNGGLRCWGAGGAGQLGDGGATDRPLPGGVLDAVGTGSLVGVTAITAGRDNTCALVGGGIQCWGANASDGQLGDGTDTASALPVHVLNRAGTG